MEEIERKKNIEQNFEFKKWTEEKNRRALEQTVKINDEDRQRNGYVKKHISEREKTVNSLLGEEEAVAAMKKMFRKQKLAEKRITEQFERQRREAAEELMDRNFATRLHNQILYGE